jgi:hypothetical protein
MNNKPKYTENIVKLIRIWIEQKIVKDLCLPKRGLFFLKEIRVKCKQLGKWSMHSFTVYALLFQMLSNYGKKKFTPALSLIFSFKLSSHIFKTARL